MGQGNRAGAIRDLSLLAQHAPAGPLHARALVLGAVAQLDGGDTTAACRALPMPIDSAAAADVMLAQNVQNLSAVCAAHVAATPDSLAAANRTVAVRDSGRATPKPATAAPKPAPSVAPAGESAAKRAKPNRALPRLPAPIQVPTPPPATPPDTVAKP